MVTSVYHNSVNTGNFGENQVIKAIFYNANKQYFSSPNNKPGEILIVVAGVSTHTKYPLEEYHMTSVLRLVLSFMHTMVVLVLRSF